MADNIELNAGSGGATLRTDDDGTAQWPYTKIAFGADNTQTIVTASVGMPVELLASSEVIGAVTQSGTWNIGTVTTVTTVSTVTAVTNLVQLGGQAISMGTGVRAAGTQRVTIATDDVVPASQSGAWNITNVSGTISLPTGASTAALQTTGNTSLSTIAGAVSGTEMQVDVVTVPAPLSTTGGGTEAAALRVTIASDSTGLVSVDDGGGALTVDNAGTFAVQDSPTTSGGLTMSKTVSAASTNATSVKGSAGQVYSVQVMNLNAGARYLKLYNKASAPTVGTDPPVKTLLIPGNTAGAGMVLNWDKGLEFTTGIAFALTTGITDADTGAVAANELVVNIDYE